MEGTPSMVTCYTMFHHAQKVTEEKQFYKPEVIAGPE